MFDPLFAGQSFTDLNHPMTDISSARILVVDDEARQMTALCDTLRDQGYDA